MPEAAHPVTERLSALAATMRDGGARVGLGELLSSHRALSAVDAASRTDAYFALRAALCSTRAELALFDEAFDTVFAEAGEDRGPLADLAGIPSAILPRAGVPGPDPRPAELELRAGPGRLERDGAAADQGLRALHRRRARRRPRAARAPGRAAGRSA